MKVVMKLRAMIVTILAVTPLLTAMSASAAAQGCSVTAGSATPGTLVGWTGTASSGFVVQSGGSVLVDCSAWQIHGTTVPGTGLPPSGLLEVTSSSMSGCDGLGMSLTVSAVSLPWRFDATGLTMSGTTPGAMSGLEIAVVNSATGGSQCTFDISGSVPASYHNPGPSLELSSESPSNLIVSNVGGSLCPLVISDGDEASIDAEFDVSAVNPAYDPIQIIC